MKTKLQSQEPNVQVFKTQGPNKNQVQNPGIKRLFYRIFNVILPRVMGICGSTNFTSILKRNINDNNYRISLF